MNRYMKNAFKNYFSLGYVILGSVVLHVIFTIFMLVWSGTSYNPAGKFIAAGNHSAKSIAATWSNRPTQSSGKSSSAGSTKKKSESKKGKKSTQNKSNKNTKKNPPKQHKQKEPAKNIHTVPELTKDKKDKKNKKKNKHEKKEITPTKQKPVLSEKKKRRTLLDEEALLPKNPLKSKKEKLVIEKKVEEPINIEESVVEEEPESVGLDLESPIDIHGDGSDDDDQDDGYQYNAAIQESVMQHWKPPIGVARGVVSVVSFVVSDQGDVESYKFIEKSNIVIFDASIRLSAKKYKFPKTECGKTIIIRFIQ